MRIPIILFLLVVINLLNAQKYLQIEKVNDPKTIKITVNSTITYKIIGDDEWRSDIIKDFLIKDSVILTNGGFIRLEEITHIQQYRRPALYISYLLQGFGTGWAIFGTLSGIREGSGEAIVGNVAFGALSYGIGWTVKKLFYKRTLPIGKRYNLRLLDLSLN